MPIEMTSRTIVQHLYDELRPKVAELSQHNRQPSLAVVLVGSDPKSELYVSSIKKEKAEELGIAFTIHRLDESTSERAIIETIEQLNNEASVKGIIIQLPLPDHIAVERILNSVALEKDVDGLRAKSPYMPPTVDAILRLFEAYDIVLEAKKIVVVGKGRLVGGPLIKELEALKLDVTACDESTDDLSACTLDADILVSATGSHHVIQPAMIKDGAVIIDVDQDVNYEAVMEKAGYITPQRGAVGPLTVACLLSNVVEATESQCEHHEDQNSENQESERDQADAQE